MVRSMTGVLISAGLVGALSSVLASLLVVAERYLVNYGLCKIDINRGEREIEIEGGGDLLGALRGNQIFIPSACGGRGTCAFCKVQVIEGAGTLGPTEAPLLTEEEIATDIRISCQCKIRNDLQVVIPAELLFVREYLGRILYIRDLTYDMKEMRIELIEPETITFTPGQYIQLEAPPYGNNTESTFRAYSISSPPSDKGNIELIIRLTPGGICTTWIFEILSEGDEVSFAGPFGDFRLSDGDGEMVWIAGGSGMAPFWSILRYMQENQIARPCTYFFGAVSAKDLFFLDELREMEKQLEWFRFVPALSNADEKTKWNGETGLITDVLDRRLHNHGGVEGYLCGSPGMIDASIEVLRNKGISEDRIYFDKFA